ncbi:MAG: hypothetical protein HY824_14425 [Acidobacteria bacterium]|nr:hypothetical protein [Acidobacteriota bacterium]
MRKTLLVPIALVGLTLGLMAQGREGTASVPVGGTPLISAADAIKPVPRMPDGRVDLTGPWVGGGSNADIEREGGLKPGELPLLPWAKELRDRRRVQDEPYTLCLPMSVPRMNPYPWKFAMTYSSRGLTHIYVLHELGDAGAHRVVYMDGRSHPPDTLPTWWGHSIGRFEGDTLVIDTVGYNDKFWFDSRGTPHTEQLHTIERWTRVNYGTLVNDFTLDDPGAYARPVPLHFTARHIRPDLDLMEFICAEDNQYGLAGGFKPAQPDR